MPDFSALPPETNSTRMYSGPGSGPILAAARRWNALANELEKTTLGLRSALSTLLESYRGESSKALIKQTLPYVQWLTTTADHADRTATQLTEAAKAYDHARAAMVPPQMVRANRVQTTVLKAFNWFGQLSTRIADKDDEYQQMWRQDAAAMTTYWEAVQEAMRSTLQFEDPPAMADDYDEAWMLNKVFDYHNENVKEDTIHLEVDVNKDRGPIELVTKVDKEWAIKLVYDGEPLFSYKNHPKF
ncbi:PPE family protein [Mycobacterium haemophilum DSM 44634]|uniref:PPE family protein n=1 Tax=Mycobacterium haemophilum TaxID=29311 RepID=UPI000654C9E5|nr:PPE family protein [Mycobacterium haemophilum]AKN18654.1 hypothetical protein B586_10660 [Mycobacterium haemophilum DSM 44634]MCV7340306.1 PPE family protein [Mycobacterium haemophilum DSM 44634]